MGRDEYFLWISVAAVLDTLASVKSPQVTIKASNAAPARGVTTCRSDKRSPIP